MGADIKSLRIRIRSVDSTLHLTRAMGLVASSKIRRATAGMSKAREYTGAMDEVVNLLRSSPDCAKSPYMVPRGKGTKIIVIAGDRGLAGGYNANIFRRAATLEGADFIPIGKRACERFGKGFESAEHFSGEDAAKLAEDLCESFLAGAFEKLGILFTRYRSLMTQEPDVLWILPLEKSTEKGKSAPIFEPDEQTVLDAAVPTYVSGMIAACVRESFACEVAARRMAMDSAGKNAQEMIDKLQLQYNRARQNTITQEITEIVAGSNI